MYLAEMMTLLDKLAPEPQALGSRIELLSQDNAIWTDCIRLHMTLVMSLGEVTGLYAYANIDIMYQ